MASLGTWYAISKVILIRRHSRRAFLQGLGGTVLALPWLESLGLAVEQKPAQRAVFYYVPIGVVRRSFFPGEGDQITPKFGGNKQSAFKTANLKVGTHPLQLTPTLQPLRTSSRCSKGT